MKDHVKNEIEKAAANTASRPETVKDLIDLLKSLPPNSKLSFSPFNLHSVVESEDRVQFEISELEGIDYNMVEKPGELTSQ